MNEPTIPYPPRFGWLKKNLSIGGLFLLAFISAMLIWRRTAQSRLDAEIAAIHTRGEPVLIEDFFVAPVPDEVNAALSLQNAAAAIAWNQIESDFVDSFFADIPLDPSKMKMLAEVAAASSKSRKLARVARFQPQENWGNTLRSPFTLFVYPYLNPARQLARLLSINAEYEHFAGNDAQAIELIRDEVHESDVLEQGDPGIIPHLVAIGLSSLSADTVRIITPDLKILPDTFATTQPTGPASKQQVKFLIAELLDDRAYRNGFRRGMQSERMIQYDAVKNKRNLSASYIFSQRPVPLLSMFQLDAIRLMRHGAMRGCRR